MKKVNKSSKMSPKMSNVSVRDTRPFTDKIFRGNKEASNSSQKASTDDNISVPPIPPVPPKSNKKGKSGGNKNQILITLG